MTPTIPSGRHRTPHVTITRGNGAVHRDDEGV
jgi:hypothetical protein